MDAHARLASVGRPHGGEVRRSIVAMIAGIALLFTSGVIVLVRLSRETEIRAPAVTAPRAQSLSVPTEVAARRPDAIDFQNGRLSVRIQNRPLDRVLDEISREGRVAIVPAEGVGGRLVSVEFSDLPIDEGLRRILNREDAFLYYRAGAMRAIWVYEPDEGRGLQPIPPELWASTFEFEEGLSDPSAEVRARSVRTLVERKGETVLDQVLTALRDDADSVRAAALFGASNADVEIPPDILSELAIYDPSVDVRFLAFEALSLAHEPNLEAIAEAALSDRSPHLRSKAREVLGRVEVARRPVEPRQPAQTQP